MNSVRCGLSSLDVAALPFYADVLGAFSAAGIDVEIQRDLGHPAEVIEMVAAGLLDVGYADIISSIRAVQAGMPVFLLAPGGLYDAREPIVSLVRDRGSPIRTAADLDARIVVTPAEHDLARLGVKCWIDTHGGNASAVRFVSGRKMADASKELRARMADAFIISEPQRTLQSAATALLATPFDAIAPQFIMGCYVASGAWRQRDPACAEVTKTVIRQTAVWANAHRSLTGPMLAERLGFDPKTIANMTRATYADTFRPDWLAPVLDCAIRYGEIEPVAPNVFPQ